jgi:hypothetical protein
LAGLVQKHGLAKVLGLILEPDLAQIGGFRDYLVSAKYMGKMTKPQTNGLGFSSMLLKGFTS